MRSIMKWMVRLLLKPALSPAVPVPLQRLLGGLIGATLLGPKGVHYEEQRRAGVNLLKITPERTRPDRSILFLHGGAYIMGGYASHKKLAAAVGQATDAQVWLPEYPLAPECPHPAAIKAALAVYNDLLEHGQDPAQLSLVGDSAGGGLALALCLTVRDGGLPMPGSLVLMSPWVDLSLSGPSMRTHGRRDPMLKSSWLRSGSVAYRATASTHDPVCSPLYADLRGLPPMLIQVGSEEILLDDARRLHDKAQAAGVNSQLTVFDRLWHVFQLHYRVIKEANTAIADAGQFIQTNACPMARAA